MIVLFFLSEHQLKEEEDNKRPVRNLSYLPGSFSFLPNTFLENPIKNNKNPVKLESNSKLQWTWALFTNPKTRIFDETSFIQILEEQ